MPDCYLLKGKKAEVLFNNSSKLLDTRKLTVMGVYDYQTGDKINFTGNIFNTAGGNLGSTNSSSATSGGTAIVFDAYITLNYNYISCIIKFNI